MQCGKCGSEKAHRSRRRGVRDWALSPLGLLPYRCGSCESRFYARDPGGPVAVRAEAAEPETRPQPETKPQKRRKPKGFLSTLKEMFDVRREKRIRIGTQIVIYGLALLLFLALLYAITGGMIPGL